MVRKGVIMRNTKRKTGKQIALIVMSLCLILNLFLPMAAAKELPLSGGGTDGVAAWTFDPQTKTMTYIKICNPTKRAYIDFTKSTKKAGLHGVGLQSVKQCCKEIGGDFVIEEKNGVVTACVTLFDVTKKVSRAIAVLKGSPFYLLIKRGFFAK